MTQLLSHIQMTSDLVLGLGWVAYDLCEGRGSF